MRPGKLIGWGITAAILIAIAVTVSVPVALLTLAFISGAPLFTIMLGAAILGAISLPRDFDSEFNGMAASMLNVGLGDPVEVMSTIPLFIYAGYLLAESGTADRLVRFANALMGWVPGGLAIVTIGTCALFTVFTGASGVTIIALGGVLMPALVRHGYPERFSMGLIAGTGSVGLLFPPALPLFIYGTVCGLNFQKMFMIPDKTGYAWPSWDTMRFIQSGIIPGLVLVGMLSAVAVFVAVKKKLPRQKFSAGELGKSFVLALPELCIPFGVIAGLAKGFGLPEIASLTVVYVVVLEVGVARLLASTGVGWGKPLPAKVLWTTSREALAMVGAIFIIIFTSTVMTNFLVTADVPTKLVAWTVSHVSSKIVFLLAINIILLIVGTVMDIFSAIVIVVPLILGVAHAYHIDPYHLGVIFLLNLEVGYLHPPVGLNLFITSVKFQRPITEVMWATIPFLVTMILALLTITYVPQLTAWSTPEEERIGKVADLRDLVHSAAESITAAKELTFVDAAGNPLNGKDGKPLTAKLADCDKIEDQSAKDTCQRVFSDVTACKGDKPCANKAVAAWVASNNAVQDDPTKQIVLVEEIPLANDKGEPVKDKKTGQPIVKKHAGCEEGSLGDSCRELFVNVSNCIISPPADSNVDDCKKAAIAKWVEGNASSD
jgi:tripartite ATP-independent transporter DctM subunit